MDQSLQAISTIELNRRIAWLLTLRWMAVIGVFVVITVVVLILKIPLPLGALYLGSVLLLTQNFFYSLYNRRLKALRDEREWFKKTNRFANLQITSDLVMLAYFIHFSGGIENPFIYYFIFHMVIASILLSRRVAFIQATLAVLFLGVVVFGEFFQIIPHYHLAGFIPEEFSFLTPSYIFVVFFVFITTLYITVYMATSIVGRLREGEGQLAVANRRLEEQDRLKSAYVLRVSHDIKSSLASIQICLKVVLDNLAGVILGKPREMVARAEQRSRHILDYVKDLLDLSRMRAAEKIEREKISLLERVNAVINQVKSKAAKKGIKMVVDIPTDIRVLANSAAVEELVANLVINAVKYTPQGGKIEIKSQGFQDPNFVHFSVSDTGIGISEDDLPHIFEDFFRAENAQTIERDGTGLGLSIAKQIVESHGGKIWVESQVTKGSVFHLILPRAE
ncbi:MAG: HAMP domain-containing histidine kinase [Elusimicrobia bacterium]|nr:HAMP domain-containing histidine kinase [Candidatus Obscuribacterium magneticum]